ncbi:MAG: type II secretion system GspH family protein, partial [Ruminococcus sp.]|nr:type II secretion system GspH family protein [Ruminococcus sp.]
FGYIYIIPYCLTFGERFISMVELIVVLVIMAILSAALVPSLIGYISQTRQSTAKNEAASVVSAAQTITSSAYADTNSTYYNQSGGSDVTITYVSVTYTFSNNDIAVVKSLSEVTGTITSITVTKGVVTAVSYTSTNNQIVTYTASADGTTPAKYDVT